MLILHLPRRGKMDKCERTGTEWSACSRTTRGLISATDVRTRGDAGRAGSGRIGISHSCQFHSFTLLCSLLVISSISPCQARPFSLIESQVGIIDQNSLTPAVFKSEGRSSQMNFYAFPADSYVELVAEKQQPQQRRKLFTEKIMLYNEEPKEKFYEPYSDIQAESPSSSHSNSGLEERRKKVSGIDVDAVVTDSSAVLPAEKGPALSQNHSSPTLVLPVVTPTDRSITEKHEKQPEVAPSFAKDSTAITIGTSPAETVASVPIKFQADPFTLSAGVTPEIHDRLFPPQNRPIASLIEELGSIL